MSVELSDADLINLEFGGVLDVQFPEQELLSHYHSHRPVYAW